MRASFRDRLALTLLFSVAGAVFAEQGARERGCSRAEEARTAARLGTFEPARPAASAAHAPVSSQWAPVAEIAGYAATISADGSTLVVGDAGVVRVIEKGSASWSDAVEVARLTASDALTGDGFPGRIAVSADGGTIGVGAPNKQIGANAAQGAVYVFARPASGWADSTETAKLVASDGKADGRLGSVVAVVGDGTTVMAGGLIKTPWGWGVITLGRLYVFERFGPGWASGTESARLVPSDFEDGDEFGSMAVSRDGTTVVAGASSRRTGGIKYEGAAYVFTRPATGWANAAENAVLTVPPPSEPSFADFFGSGVAVSGDGTTVVVGTAKLEGGPGFAGVFLRPGAVWMSSSTPAARLTATDADIFDYFGVTVGISEDGSLVAVAAPGRRVGWSDRQGQVYAFVRPASGWASGTESARLVASVGGPDTAFGLDTTAVADGPAIVLQARAAPSSGQARAYVFEPGRTSAWVPVASHVLGLNGSVWRSDLGILNPGQVDTSVEVRLHAASGTLSSQVVVPAGGQVVLRDVAGQLGFEGSAPLEVLSDQAVVVTSRTYADTGHGTVSQSYGAYRPGEGLAAGQSVYMPQLVENAAYRTNIGLANLGTGPASVTVELHDGPGTLLQTYTVDLGAGEWRQETRPFFARAGQTAMDHGYTKITVTQGYGLIALASVIDNFTNDATTVEPPFELTGWDFSAWIPVTSHSAGLGGSEWRSDVAILNPLPAASALTVRLYAARGDVETTVLVPGGAQIVLDDVVGKLGAEGSAPIEVELQSWYVLVASRTYTRSGEGTVGQPYRSYGASQALRTGQTGWLAQLAESAAYRSNVSLANLSNRYSASAVVELHDGSGALLATYTVDLAPGEWRQETRPFFTKAGRTAMDAGYAKVVVTAGYGVVATASVVDNGTNDPTTVPMVR